MQSINKISWKKKMQKAVKNILLLLASVLRRTVILSHIYILYILAKRKMHLSQTINFFSLVGIFEYISRPRRSTSRAF